MVPSGIAILKDDVTNDCLTTAADCHVFWGCGILLTYSKSNNKNT